MIRLSGTLWKMGYQSLAVNNLAEHIIAAWVHISAHQDKDRKYETELQEKSIMLRQKLFDDIEKKQRKKVTFHGAIETFKQRDKYHRGHVEFIYAAMKKMKEFGVEEDLETYKRLISLFPEGKMVPKNLFQAEFMHYPKHQECAINILEKMEDNGVCPDDDLGFMLVARFGSTGHPVRKFQRMFYWMPKFKNITPFPLPKPLPADDIELAKLALKRMAVDMDNKIEVHQTDDIETAMDHTYVVSAQSPEQQRLLSEHTEEKPVFVDGVFSVWLRKKCVHYCILSADARVPIDTQENEETEGDDMFDFHTFLKDEKPKEVIVAPTVHEQEDGIVLAMCVTGTCSRDSLMSWIKILQRTNPKLANIPVVFRIRTLPADLQTIEEKPEDLEVT